MNHKDVWTRAIWTFVQAFIASLLVTGASKAALVAAAAAGLSAVKTYWVQISTQ